MNSVNKNKKNRKNVVIRCRKISSTSNRSQHSFHHAAPSGKLKRHISTLLKNNKVLALALEDTRCELSTKKKLLDEFYQILNNVKFARFKILEMQSVLKSFIKNFDEVLLILKMDSSKCLDLEAPVWPKKNWKNKMKKIVELDHTYQESMDEETAYTADKAVENSTEIHDEIMENPLNVHVNNTVSQATNMNKLDEINDNCCLIEDNDSNTQQTHNECLSTCTENITSSIIHEIEPQLASNLQSENCEGIMATENVLLLNSEDTGTPKLNISLELVDIKSFSEVDANVLPPDEYSSTKSPNAMSPVKAPRSKIPKIEGLHKAKITENSAHIHSKKRKTNKIVDKGAEKSNLNLFKENKFNTKDDKRLSKSGPFDISDEIPEARILPEKNINESCKTVDHRKTFVVKPSDTTENPHSLCDRRKTFVKTASDRHSRRKTFTVSKHPSTLSKLNEGHVDQTEINSVKCVSVQKDVYLCTNGVTNEINKPISVETSERIQCNSANFENVNIHDYPQDLQKIVSKSVESYQGRSSEKFVKKGTCGANDLQKHSVENNEMLDNIACDSPNNKNILEDNVNSDKTLAHSELDLESSESECESIPELDLCSVKEVLFKDAPIRRQISNAPKRVFLFDANKKYVLNEKSDCGFENFNFSEENKVSCQPDINNVNDIIKNHQIIGNQKEKKRISFIHSNEKNIIDNAHSNLTNDQIPGNKRKVKSKIGKKYECAEEGVTNCVTSLTASNCIENCVSSPTDKNEILSEQKVSSCSGNNEINLNTKHNVLSNDVDSSFEILLEKDKGECFKINAKQNGSEINPIPKKSKRNTKSEKKKSEDVCLDVNCVRLPTDKNEILREQKASCSGSNEINSDTKLNVLSNDLSSSFEILLNEKDKGECLKMNAKQNDSEINPISKKSTRKTRSEKKKSEDACLDVKVQKNAPENESGKRKKMIDDIPDKTFLTHAEVHPVPLLCMSETGNSNKKNEEMQELNVKLKKKSSKTKINRKKKLIHNMPDKTFLTHAEVHPEPPLYIPETSNSHKENKMQELQNFQVSVILNDIFKSENNNTLNVCLKEQVLQGSRTDPLKTVHSDNSCNIPLPGDDAQKDKNTVVTTRTSEDSNRRRRRNHVSYTEISLKKKLRQ